MMIDLLLGLFASACPLPPLGAAYLPLPEAGLELLLVRCSQRYAVVLDRSCCNLCWLQDACVTRN
jgi:hypothetical protein